MSNKNTSPLSVAQGATGATSFSTNAVLCAGSTSTSPFTSITGTSGYVLTSQGNGNPPIFSVYPTVLVSLTTTQVFSTNGTYVYTPTSNMVYCIVECVGAGGGAGYVSSASAATTGGGGAGGYTKGLISAATVGAGILITIGLAGSGGIASSSTVATSGGTTYFGPSITPILTANGGNASASITSSSTVSAAATGGSASGGFVSYQGNYGNPGLSVSGSWFLGGQGGSSLFGSGGIDVVTATDVNGNNATGNGAGGGGCANNATSNVNGGNGTDGIIVITEFIS